MKRKQTKIVLIAATVFLIGAGGAFVGWKLYQKHRAVGWGVEGIAACNSGDYEKASGLLARYLHAVSGKSSSDVAQYNEVLECYVKSLEHQDGSHFAEILDALKRIVSRTDTLEDRKHLLRVYVKLERRPEALDTADGILSRKEWASDVEVLQLKAETLAILHRDHEAFTTATEWAKLAPLDVKAHVTILSLKYAGKHPDVIQYATDLHDHHPNDARFEFLQAYALDCYIKDPESRTNNDDDARKKAAELLRTAAAHPDLTEDLALLIVEEFDAIGMPEDAVKTLEQAAKHGGGPAVRYAFAKRCWELGRWADVASMLADLNSFGAAADPTILAMKAMALAYLSKTQDANAFRAVLAEKKDKRAQAWTLILRRVIDGGNLDDKDVVEKCQAALSTDPRNPYLEYYLGDSQFRLGEVDLALRAWGRATFDDKAWAMPATRLVDLLLRQGRTEEAHWVALESFRHNRSTGAFISLSRAVAADVSAGGDDEQVDALLKMTDTILSKVPGEEGTTLIHVRILARDKKNTPEAIKSARAAIDREPAPSQSFLLAMARLSRELSLDLQEECFSRCEHAHGVTADLAFGRAMDHVLASPPDAAAGLHAFDELAARQGHAQEEAWRFARARYLDATGNADAKAAWAALGDASPDSVAIQMAVINARATQGDRDIVQRAIDRLHKKTGDSGLDWRVAQAKLLIGSARNDTDYEQGAVLLNKVVQQYPGTAEPRVLLAVALEHMKRADGAIEQLTTAAKLEPFSVPIALQLAGLLQSRGDFERSNEILERLSHRPLSTPQLRQVAVLMAQAGNTEAATKYLEHAQTQPSTSSDPADSLLLATMYRRRGEFDKCEAIIVKLLENPTLVNIQFAASFYGSRQREKDAEAALGKLDSLNLDPGIKELAWGGYFAGLGDLADAAKHYKAATTAAPANPITWRMLSLIQATAGQIDGAMETINHGLAVVPADPLLKAIQARADLLRKTKGAGQLRQFVLQVIRDPLNSDLVAELLGLLLDARTTNDMQSLASRLQQFNERHPDFLMSQIQLAYCMASMDRRDDALAVAQHAMTTFPESPEPARLETQLCGAWNRWSDMEAAARTWRTRAPDDWNADVALARAELYSHKYQAAISLLLPHLPLAKENPDQYADLLTAYAACAANSGQLQVADDLIWPLAQKSAPWRLRWVQVAANIEEPKDAIPWLTRVLTIIPKEDMEQRIGVAEALDLLSQKTTDPAVAQQSANVFTEICADPKVTGVALMAAGARSERHGDPAIAIDLYHRALAIDPKLWAAHNNLAILLARSGGDLKEAVTHANAAVQANPQSANTRDTLAEVQGAQGDFRAAAQTEQVAVQLEPTNAKWRIRTARYWLDANDPAAAAKTMQEYDDRRLDLHSFSEKDQKALTLELNQIRARLRGGAKTN